MTSTELLTTIPVVELVFNVSGIGQTTRGGTFEPTTVTFCAHVLEFPRMSLTVQVTIVCPTGNWPGALFDTVASSAPQLSLKVGVPSATPVT